MSIIYSVQSAVTASPTIAFASCELQRCLNRLDSDLPIQIMESSQYNLTEPGLWLGLFSDVGLTPRSNHPFDDEIHVDVEGGNGLIAGANPRSLLMAVYRYLGELGCRWLHPGPEGEFFPETASIHRRVQLHERPSYRHRAICIEGAVSLENVLEMIDWLPKVGLSGYFMQFREGFTFFDRWYRHQNNPLKVPEPFSVEQARAFTRQVESELQKRSLIYQAIGHGWTCEAYGIECLGWDMEPGRAWPEEFLHDVAEVNDQRCVPWDIVSIAALCYSDPQVQTRLADCVVEYAASHPQIDLLHVWLDDGFNNKCECDRCRTHLPSDDYIVILNAIEERMRRRGLPQKVVFLAYVDMLWPPERERIHHPERFVFMFAPISRTYRHEMKPVSSLPPRPPFERNHLAFPTDIPGLLSFLQGWQDTFQGDSFVYDYHFISDGLYLLDPGQLRLARLVHEDMKSLKSLGMDGMVSCQLQRVFFPTGLGQYAMARTLWDDTLSFDDLAADYFASAFGISGARVQAYLGRLAELIDFGWLKNLDTMDEGEAQHRCQSALLLIRRFLPVIRRSLADSHPVHHSEVPFRSEVLFRHSWQVLFHHAQVTRRLVKILQASIQGRESRVNNQWQALRQYVCQHEDEFQPALDVWAFVAAYERLLKR